MFKELAVLTMWAAASWFQLVALSCGAEVNMPGNAARPWRTQQWPAGLLCLASFYGAPISAIIMAGEDEP